MTSVRRLIVFSVLALTVGLSAQTGPGSYAPSPAPQFFTDAGAVCGGCWLYTYAAGGTTPLATYSDVSLSTPNANPIVLDAAGRATIYLQKSTYRFDLKTAAGSLIWTRDQIASTAQLAANATALVIQTLSTTGTINDLALTSGASVLKMSNASLATITGLAAGVDGQRLTIISTGAGEVDLSHQAGGSAAANRLINLATVGATPLAGASGSATYVYDGTASRWRLVSHEQGAWITPTFSAGNYSGGWTLAAGDVVTQAYYLKGRTLMVSFYLQTITMATTPTIVTIGNGAWGGFVANKPMLNPLVQSDAAAANAGGFAQVTAGASSIQVLKYSGTWGNATDTTSVLGQLTFEVQ